MVKKKELRTFTQAGTELGFNTNLLEFATGRSDKLKTKSALGVYTSYRLEPAVEVYNRIADALLNNSDEWTDRVAIRVGKPAKPNLISSLKDMQKKIKRSFN